MAARLGRGVGRRQAGACAVTDRRHLLRPALAAGVGEHVRGAGARREVRGSGRCAPPRCARRGRSRSRRPAPSAGFAASTAASSAGGGGAPVVRRAAGPAPRRGDGRARSSRAAGRPAQRPCFFHWYQARPPEPMTSAIAAVSRREGSAASLSQSSGQPSSYCGQRPCRVKPRSRSGSHWPSPRRLRRRTSSASRSARARSSRSPAPRAARAASREAERQRRKGTLSSRASALYTRANSPAKTDLRAPAHPSFRRRERLVRRKESPWRSH